MVSCDYKNTSIIDRVNTINEETEQRCGHVNDFFTKQKHIFSYMYKYNIYKFAYRLCSTTAVIANFDYKIL